MSATKRSMLATKPQRLHLRLPQIVRGHHNSYSSCNKNTTFSVLAIIGLLLQAAIPSEASQHPVNIFSNSSTVLGQMKTSSTLVWESYDAKSPHQLHYAVEGGKYITEEEHYPIYVCRVYIDGLYSNGHTEKVMQTQSCVAGHKRYENFDVLVNKGHLGKVAWMRWSKLDAGGTPLGAIRFGDENVYIARHQQAHERNEQGLQMGADYNLGRLDPEGFGKIKVIERNSEERFYDEGELLIETQPFRYELRDIKLEKLRLDMRENLTELATATLVNRDNEYSVVETVISYQFDHIQNWGSHEGTARGLPTKVFEKDSSTPAEVYWGIKKVDKKFETKSVHTKLWPGTAMNVTLVGNYVTLMAPYAAKLYAFYYGLEESVSRKIHSEVIKSYLKDVKLEFSPVYFIENGTIVPSTTTSSTSSSTSTTSTTTRATTTTGQPKPISEPPVVHVKNIGDQHSGPDTLETSLHDSPVQNEIPQDGPENLSEHHQKHALAGIAAGNVASALQKWSICTSFVAFISATLLSI